MDHILLLLALLGAVISLSAAVFAFNQAKHDDLMTIDPATVATGITLESIPILHAIHAQLSRKVAKSSNPQTAEQVLQSLNVEIDAIEEKIRRRA